MDIDLREMPAFSNVPEGGFDLIPRKVCTVWFGPCEDPAKVTVGPDGSAVDCGPDWDAVTEGGKITGFSRKASSDRPA